MNGDPLDELDEQAEAVARLRLTDEERAALHWFAHYGLPEHRAATLRGLLERLAAVRSSAGYCRQNPDGSRYDWAAEERKRKQEPAAWLAFATDGSESSAVYLSQEQAQAAADEWGWSIAPLYCKTQGANE